MAAPAQKRATYADVVAAPAHLVAEIIDGALVTHPVGLLKAAVAATALGAELSPFRKDAQGRGNWVFIGKPEIHMGDDVLVPDIAGWRDLVSLPDGPYWEARPDWVCEILSDQSVALDRNAKRRIYAGAGVGHLWLLDPRVQVLEAFALTDGAWRLAGTWTSDDEVRAPPFDAISFSLADLWPLDRPLGFEENPQHLFAGDR